MSKLFNWAAARLVAAFALTLPLAAMANVDYTGTVYEPWSYSAGCVAWRATESLFHSSTVVDVPADGVIVEENAYALGSSGHPWNVFASTVNSQPNANYTSPGVTLVYDVAGKTAATDAQFAPLSLGGLWVKVLQSENTPYCITDTKTDGSNRQVELGATSASTYFKFDESFTFNRNSATAVKGTATVEIASGKTFTINARANKGAVVDASNTLVLTGAGTLAVVGGLSVSGTLDLSAATRPTIDGDVTLAADSTIVLPAGTTVDSTTPFAVCTGTLSVGGPVNVKIGTADPVSASLTVTNGGITLIETTTTYTATISGDTAFSAISWEKGGVAATISDISTAILELSGSGKVTGLSDSPTSIEIASGIVFDMTSVSNVGSIDLKGAGTFLFAANYPATVPAGLHYEYQGGVDSGSSQAIDGVAVRGTLTTTGFVGLTNFEIASGGTYEVASNGYATVSAKAQCKLSGNITIGEGATFVNAKTAGNDAADALNYGAQGCVITVRGTLNMGSTRWSLRSKSYHEIRLYDGAVICGEGQSSYGALDYIENESGAQIDTYGGNVTVSAGIRVRAGANVAFWVADGATNTISGTTVGAGTFSKSGTGTLNLTGTIGNGALALNEGCVNVGSSMDVNIVCNNANGYVTASDNVVVGGTIALANTSFTPHAVLTTFLQDSSAWHGTLSVPAIANDNLNASFLTTYGNDESLIALGGISGASTYIMASGSTTYNVGGLRIDGATEFNNGSSKSTVNFAKITGTNNLTLVGWSGCSEARYNLNKIEGYSGALTIHNAITRDQGGTLTIGIGNIVTTGSTAPGSCVLSIVNTAVENATGTVVYNLDNAQVNGAAANLEVKSDGIYVAMPSVTINVPKVPNTTVAVSVGGNPVSPATEGETTNTYSVVSGATVTVTYTSDDYEVTGGTFEFTATDGYTVNTAEVVTKQYVASITIGDATTKYSSLQAAFDATAQSNSKVVLLANEVVGATIPAVNGKMFYFYAGEFTHGEIANAEGNFITTATEEQIEIGSETVTATKYRVLAAVALVVLANEQSGTYYGDYMAAYNAFLAGPVGTTMQVFGDNPFSEIPCTTYDSETQTYTKLEAVASITVGQVTSNYPSLAAAVAAATAGQTVTMLADDRVSFAAVTVENGVPSGGSIVIDKNITINGAGFTVYGNTNAEILNATGSATPGYDMVADLVDGSNLLGFFVKSGNVTFQNVTLTEFGNTAYVNKFGYTPIQTASAYTGTLTLTNVNFNKFNRTAVCVRGGTLAMTGGTIAGGTVNKNNGDYFQQPVEVRGGTATIDGVTITGGNDIVGGNGGGAIVAWGDTTVNNVNIDFTGIGVWADVANVAITGDDTEISATTQSVFVEEGGSATIAAGDFSGSLAVDSDANSSITVSGGTFNAVVPDEYLAEGYEVLDNGDGTYGVRVDRGWIYEVADYPNYTGSWSNEVVYSEGKAHIEDGNTYTANRPSDGRMVTVAMTLSFDDVNDEDETVGDAKAAVKLATGGFKVYTSEGPDGAVTSVWKSVTIEGSDMIPVADQDYKFLFVLDLTNTTYTAALITSGGAATNALVLTDGSVANIPFASRGNVAPVQKIEFIGSGSVTSIEGSYEDGPAPVDVFVEDESITLSDGSVSLSADQAAWLNKLGAKSDVATRLGQLTSAQFSAAYLLNLDLMGDFTYAFKATDITVGDSYVEVEVTLTRTGTRVDGKASINGTLKLTGTDELGHTFEVKDTATITDAHFSAGDGEATISFPKDASTKFFQPVIE